MLLTLNDTQSLDILQCALTKHEAPAQPMVEPNPSHIILWHCILFIFLKDKTRWQDPSIRYKMTTRKSICSAPLSLHRKSPSGETYFVASYHVRSISFIIYQECYQWVDRYMTRINSFKCHRIISKKSHMCSKGIFWILYSWRIWNI